MNQTYLITGSNIGDKKNHLSVACDHIEKRIGKVVRYSSLYETESWGKTDQPPFLNQVLLVESELGPKEIMLQILEIENEMGRVRTEKYASRIIDIDILFFNNEIIVDEVVTVPHKEICNRNFVLEPLHEIAADFVHPVQKKTIKELLSHCEDRLKVRHL